MSNNVVLWSVADDLRGIATELESLTLYTDDVTDVSSIYPTRGTIVKAKASQTRYKPTSMWVSNGDGTYSHLTGKKFLQAKHERLEGFVDTVFRA